MFCSESNKRSLVARRISGLYAIVDATYLTADEMAPAAAELVDGGARLIQIRAKGCNSAEMLSAARAAFIVNDRVDIALLSESDGVHLGQEDLPVEAARKLLGENAIIGLSTHTIDEAKAALKAAEAGIIDYISFGPIFSTSTKPDARETVGLCALGEVAALSMIPVVAIGGIKTGDIKDVLSAGAGAVVLISALLGSKDKQEAMASAITEIEGSA